MEMAAATAPGSPRTEAIFRRITALAHGETKPERAMPILRFAVRRKDAYGPAPASTLPLGGRSPPQPIRQIPGASVVEDVLTNQLPDDLGRCQVMCRADLFKELLLERINKNREAGGALFHGGILLTRLEYKSYQKHISYLLN